MIRSLSAVAVAVSVVLASGCSLGTPKPATYVTDISATLNAEVSSNQSGEVRYWFEYGTTTDYGEVTPDRALTFPEGHDSDDPPVVVSEPVNGLDPDTTYHFRVCTSPGVEAGSRGCTNQDQAFTTGPAGGRSGIAFASDRVSPPRHDVFVMDSDGTDQTNLTSDLVPTASSPDFSPHARSLAFSSTSVVDGAQDIFVMPADGGARVNITNASGEDHGPSWSPDGSKIAFFTFRNGNSEIYVMDADGSDQTNLSSNPAIDLNTAWSPDGSRIAFTSERDGNQEIYVMDADGSDQTRLTNDASQDAFPAWSPDGRQIAFASGRSGNLEVYVMSADGSSPTNLTNHASVDITPAWSPDGSQIAFSTTRDGNQEIYVMDADGSDQTNLSASPTLDAGPSWSPRP